MKQNTNEKRAGETCERHLLFEQNFLNRISGCFVVVLRKPEWAVVRWTLPTTPYLERGCLRQPEAADFLALPAAGSGCGQKTRDGRRCDVGREDNFLRVFFVCRGGGFGLCFRRGFCFTTTNRILIVAPLSKMSSTFGPRKIKKV